MGDEPGPVEFMDARRLGQEVVAAIPGGAVIVFDSDLRIVFAEGAGLLADHYELSAIKTQLLRDAFETDAWSAAGASFSDALNGNRTSFDSILGAMVYTTSVSPLTDHNGIIGGIAISHGISLQHELESKNSERELNLILNNIPDAVSVQGNDHRYRLVNDAFERRFGVSRGEVIGRRDEEILSPEAMAQDRSSHADVLRTGEPVQQEETVPVGGEDHIFQTVTFPLRDEKGEIYGVCDVFNDITDRKRREFELQDHLAWTERIHSGLHDDRLILHGQPIVDLGTGEITQAELLIRMVDRRDPHRLISPGEFLPAAERLGLVSLIDRWVVARGLEMARNHRVEINLSGLTISDSEQVARIETMVVESDAPPENIIFEITETAVAENMDSSRLFAERLRDLGCSFALDDFGVGFGTFTYLKHLPVDYLKIDIEFVRDLVRDETSRHVVSTIVAAAELFGIRTIAEGVEDEETYEALIEIGVDLAQGYWIGRPVDTQELWKDTVKP